MIIVDEIESLTLITQPDHARLAGQILSLWRADGLPDHPRRDDLLFATREHDNGWQEADSAPWFDSSRDRPHDFTSYPDSERLLIWERGIYRFAADRPLVALLIAEHAEALHQPLDERWQEFFARLQPHRQAWLEAAKVDRQAIQQDYKALHLADTLSLAVCTRRSDPFRFAGYQVRVVEERLLLDPFPLAGTTTFRLPCRRIPNRPYGSDTEIGSALARARWEQSEVKIGPEGQADA